MRRATTNAGTHCVCLNTTTDRQDTGRKGRVVREGRVGREDGKSEEGKNESRHPWSILKYYYLQAGYRPEKHGGKPSRGWCGKGGREE